MTLTAPPPATTAKPVAPLLNPSTKLLTGNSVLDNATLNVKFVIIECHIGKDQTELYHLYRQHQYFQMHMFLLYQFDLPQELDYYH